MFDSKNYITILQVVSKLLNNDHYLINMKIIIKNYQLVFAML